MTTFNPLGPKLKIARANRHIENLKNLFETFICDNPNRIEIHENSDKKSFSVRGIFDRDLPPDTPTIIGDALHNLRAALDHLAAEAVRAGGCEPTRGICFPIHKCKSGFDGAVAGALKGAPQVFVDFVKRQKPHKEGGSAALYNLSKLDNLDKHMVLIPSISVVRLGGINVVGPDGTIRQAFGEIEICGGKGQKGALLLGGWPDCKLEPKGRPTFSVCFSKTGLVDGKNVVELLEELSAQVAEIVGGAIRLGI